MRIAVISDIHANLPALEAVIGAAGAVDAWWHCGDIVGYGPHPNEVVDRLRGLGAVGVAGNHDAAALGSTIVDLFNPDAYRAAMWTREAITEETRAWLDALPQILEYDDITVVHGSLRNPLEEYVTTKPAAAAVLDRAAVPVTLHGHTHVPMRWHARPSGGLPTEAVPVVDRPVSFEDGRYLLNPGSVGQPRDLDRNASFLVLDTDARIATWRRIAYPVRETQAAIRKAGLPDRLAARLDIGR